LLVVVFLQEHIKVLIVGILSKNVGVHKSYPYFPRQMVLDEHVGEAAETSGFGAVHSAFRSNEGRAGVSGLGALAAKGDIPVAGAGVVLGDEVCSTGIGLS
jgi:hypothetical protein